MNLYDQIEALYLSLGEFKATDSVSANVGDLFDALLASAKDAHKDNPVVSVIKPTGRTMLGNPAESAGDLRALCSQLMTAIGSS